MSYLYLCLLKGEPKNVNVTALIEIILVRFKVSSWPSIEGASYTFLCRFCQDLSDLTRSAYEQQSSVLPQITDMGYSSCFDLNPSEACLETTFQILSEVFQQYFAESQSFFIADTYHSIGVEVDLHDSAWSKECLFLEQSQRWCFLSL